MLVGEMRFGVLLYALTLLCFAIVGPFGPCGPGSPTGVMFLVGGAVGELAAVLYTTWFVIVGIVSSTTRRAVGAATGTATVIVTLATATYLFVHPEDSDLKGVGWLAAWSWPGLTAATFLIRPLLGRGTTVRR